MLLEVDGSTAKALGKQKNFIVFLPVVFSWVPYFVLL